MRKKSTVLRSAVVCLLAAASAFAQQPVPAPSSASSASAPGPAAAAAPAPAQPKQPLTEYALVRNARSHADVGEAGLGDRMIVEVGNFPKLLDAAGGNCADIVLFLDTLPMNLRPESCDVQNGTVRYLLTRNDKNDQAWHWLLGNPRHFTKNIQVSVGTGMTAINTRVTAFPIRVIPRMPFYGWILATLAGVIFFVHLCRTTGLIRGARTAAIKPTEKPYSLANFQMAFWFFLVVDTYVFIWLVTGELDTITESILALIGIGAGTALGSAMIDTNAGEGSADKTSAAAADEQKTRGFLKDVLDDGGGISFHRFQMFIWTLVLGVIFAASVYRHLAMPQFSATLLGLLGVSSGTYLGFKFPEKTNREVAQTAADETAAEKTAVTIEKP
jgi:hypothetical protein